ncbi:MAG: hypothetical protein GY751_19880 [Bacteroidetes bacterium]|jgi:hypothetical protein|nr:hypothetical protein [Bacteroidota bacterium]
MTEEQIVEIVEQISDLEVDELKELAKAIRDLIDEKDVSEDVNVGDLVTFEIRDGTTLTGLVQSTTAKRATVVLNAAEGLYTINLKNVAILESAPAVADDSTEGLESLEE